MYFGWYNKAVLISFPVTELIRILAYIEQPVPAQLEIHPDRIPAPVP